MRALHPVVLAAAILVLGLGGHCARGRTRFGVSLGLAVTIRACGREVFTRECRPSWLDHYRAIQIAGGAIMVALGLLLFFERFYISRVYLNRFLEWLDASPRSSEQRARKVECPRCEL